MRRSWGLRTRVLVAAAVTAAVALLTFGILLKGLQDQRSAAAQGRGTSEALVAAGQLQRLLPDLGAGATAAANRARQELPGVQRRLRAAEQDPEQVPLVARINAGLSAYAAGRGSFDTLRGQIDRYVAAEQTELLARRARSTTLRNRSIATATAGLVVLLALIGLLAAGAVRAIVTPVGRLQLFARELGAGRLDARLAESGPPETAELAHVFNLTAAELEKAQAELRRISERHLAELDAVFASAPLGLAFVDRELRFLRANDALAEMDGRPAGEHPGRPVSAVLEHPDEVEAALHEVIDTGQPVLDRDLVRDGRTFLTSYFPVRGEGGQLAAVGVAVTDVTARRRAEVARERLQAATAALAAAMTVDDVAHAAVEEAGAALEPARATLTLVDGDLLRNVEARALPPDELARWRTIALSARLPSAEAARTREAVFALDAAEVGARWPELAGSVHHAYAALPLIASGRVLGVLALSFSRPMAFDAGERALLDALAAQCAVALNRAQLYEREHTVSRTLQASLLPRALPQIPGLDLAARLESGAPGLEVGGDFYDAFALADGAWGLAIGDVCGKGVDAAALTALARHTMRAAARTTASPAGVLAALNRAVLDESRPGQFLTAIFARLQARPSGGFELRLANGGHPPAVLLDGELEPRALDCTGTLLGVVEDPDLSDCAIELAPGDTLLLYTDGLTEAAAPERTLTTEDVAELLARVRGETAAQTAEACLRLALFGGGAVARDDVAVLVAQLAPRVRSTAGRTPAGESSTPGQ
jgi:PAS domain S-box-containing protein